MTVEQWFPRWRIVQRLLLVLFVGGALGSVACGSTGRASSTGGSGPSTSPSPAFVRPDPSGVSGVASSTPQSQSTTASGGVVQPQPPPAGTIQEFSLPGGSAPHDVAPAADGTVWYTAQAGAEIGRLNPATGAVQRVSLGQGSAPHGVILGPDGAAWVTDGGRNAIVRVDPQTLSVRAFPLPTNRPNANLNTATFDNQGRLWFTGQGGIYGRLEPRTGAMTIFDAPRGPGPYGITRTPDGTIYFASLAGSYIARVDPESGAATVLEPPTPGQGARRIWADSQGKVWVSEWNAGQLACYDPATNRWREWKLPGSKPMAYAVYVDDRDGVWVTDFGANAIVRFDQVSEQFTAYPLPAPQATVRQLLGRPGEVWGAEQSVNRLVVVRSR